MSFDYRRGVFGFLATDAEGANGMNGLDDQVLALRWIRDYVPYFGGDADAVTVVGTGPDGAAAACLLAVAPAARGLFRRAALQGGECLVGDGRTGGRRGVLAGPDGYARTLAVLRERNATLEELADPDLFPAREIAGALRDTVPILDRSVLPDWPR